MNFFISDALAAAPEGGGDALTSFLPLIFIFVVFYFLLIRPQSKKAKEHKKMVEALAKGDEVVTSSGILGKIASLDDIYIVLTVAEKVDLKFQRVHIHAVLPKGTLKSIG
jgi:preprotein translocase subunit YajC